MTRSWTALNSMVLVKCFFILQVISLSSVALGDEEMDRSSFPPGFLFGTSSSAYQIEGAYREDGKSLSNWDVFTHMPGTIVDGSNGDVATDQYHRYLEDIQLMDSIGVDAYRFSIAWSRIMRNDGSINSRGIEYYDNLINALLAKGIQPFVTLSHFDLPQHLEDAFGGWLSPHIVKEFGGYAETCFKAFGDRVKHWATFNEPNGLVLSSYQQGTFPPNRCSPPYGNCTAGDSKIEPYLAAHHILLSHAEAVYIYRKKYQPLHAGSIGIVIASQWYEPLRKIPDDRSAALRMLAFETAWFLDPIVFGEYPPEMRRLVGQRLPSFSTQALHKLRGSFDFIGINHYTSFYVKDRLFPSSDDQGPILHDALLYTTGERDGVPIGEQMAMGEHVVPYGMEKIVMYVKERYNSPVIIITENGYAEENDPTIPLRKALNDVRRVNLHKQYLAHLATAIRRGADVRGYFIWSILDNFEWLFGYTKRFGLYHVDFSTQNRYPKLSAKWYKQFLNHSKGRYNANKTMIETKTNSNRRSMQ